MVNQIINFIKSLRENAKICFLMFGKKQFDESQSSMYLHVQYLKVCNMCNDHYYFNRYTRKKGDGNLY